MKLQGILGKGTGKLGNAVFAVSGGEQIMREYNPNVSNPNTEAQVAQRAKLKLMSQLAASLSSVIAIPKQGLVSSRNLFIKENIGLATIEKGVAKVEFPEIQLTKGAVQLPAFEINKDQEKNLLILNFNESVKAKFDHVVIVGCTVTDGERISVNGSVVVDVADGATSISTGLGQVTGDFIYVYGIKDKTGAAGAKFESYEIDSADQVAQLVTSRSLSVADYTFTSTLGAFLNV